MSEQSGKHSTASPSVKFRAELVGTRSPVWTRNLQSFQFSLPGPGVLGTHHPESRATLVPVCGKPKHLSNRSNGKSCTAEQILSTSFSLRQKRIEVEPGAVKRQVCGVSCKLMFLVLHLQLSGVVVGPRYRDRPLRIEGLAPGVIASSVMLPACFLCFLRVRGVSCEHPPSCLPHSDGDER